MLCEYKASSFSNSASSYCPNTIRAKCLSFGLKLGSDRASVFEIRSMFKRFKVENMFKKHLFSFHLYVLRTGIP